MDLTETIAPKSDQINAEDLLSGPRTFTIEKVTAGSAEQPVNVHLRELPGRPYRPSKSMRRVMVAAWGPEASQYAGRRLTLYRDPDVKFGGMIVGGLKISRLSHIDGPREIPLTVTRGKRALHRVQPLTDAPTPTGPTVEQVQATESVDELRAMWSTASPEVQAAIKVRVAELQQPTTPPADPEQMSDAEFAAAAGREG